MQSSLEQAVAEMTAELNLKGQGAEEERARIIAWFRRKAENSTEADDLNHYADCIEAGFHWDMTEEEEAALDKVIEE